MLSALVQLFRWPSSFSVLCTVPYSLTLLWGCMTFIKQQRKELNLCLLLSVCTRRYCSGLHMKQALNWQWTVKINSRTLIFNQGKKLKTVLRNMIYGKFILHFSFCLFSFAQCILLGFKWKENGGFIWKVFGIIYIFILSIKWKKKKRQKKNNNPHFFCTVKDIKSSFFKGFLFRCFGYF